MRIERRRTFTAIGSTDAACNESAHAAPTVVDHSAGRGTARRAVVRRYERLMPSYALTAMAIGAKLDAKSGGTSRSLCRSMPLRRTSIRVPRSGTSRTSSPTASHAVAGGSCIGWVWWWAAACESGEAADWPACRSGCDASDGGPKQMVSAAPRSIVSSALNAKSVSGGCGARGSKRAAPRAPTPADRSMRRSSPPARRATPPR